jgi:hypothetical protein
MTRAMASVPPPGGKPTSNLTVVSACAPDPQTAAMAKRMRAMDCFNFMLISW